MKNLIGASIIAGAISITGCNKSENPQPTQISQENNYSVVENISPQVANKITGILEINNNENNVITIEHCNYARVEISPRKALVTTAGHCIESDKQEISRHKDIILSEFMEEIAKKFRGNNAKTLTRTSKPDVLSASDENINSIIGKELTIVGCFPDNNKYWCYTITGNVTQIYKNHALLAIQQSDYHRILSHDTSGKRKYFEGMSGSPVLDSEGKYFGVLNKHFTQGENHFLGITSIRDHNNHITNIF